MAQCMVSMPALAEEMPRAARFQHQFKKTVLCKFFAERNCRKGDACNFAHNIDEICAAPDLTKTSLCKMYKAGSCNKDSASCPFAHGPRELRCTPLFRSEGKPWREDNHTGSGTNGAPMLADAPHHAQVHKAGNMMLPGASLPAMSGNDAKLTNVLDFAPVEEYEDLSDWSSVDSGSWGRESCDRLSPLPPRLVGPQIDPAMPMFFQRNALPLSAEALESLLKNAMPDQYED